MCGLDPGTRAGLEEALNALVPEASDHYWIVARSATSSECSNNSLEVGIPIPTKNVGAAITLQVLFASQSTLNRNSVFLPWVSLHRQLAKKGQGLACYRSGCILPKHAPLLF
jgi:hypothetical protein